MAEPRKNDKVWDEKRLNTPGLQPNGIVISVEKDGGVLMGVWVKFFDEVVTGKTTVFYHSERFEDTYKNPQMGFMLHDDGRG